MKFTPENLIENIDKVGSWSIYGLAAEALQHYFPNEYDENDSCKAERETDLLAKLGFKYWHEVVVKYQKEIGYNAPNGFDKDFVNER